jgi:hypothetical protein
MAMADKDHGSAIGRAGKEPLYGCCVGRDYRTTAHPGSCEQFFVGHDAFSHPPKRFGSPGAKPGIAEERISQQRVLTMLDQNAGDTQVGDGDKVPRISAGGRRAPESVRT